MPYAAITYNIKPGFEDEIAEIFANFKRVDSPILRNEEGEQVGRLLGTAVFIKNDLMVRVIHYEGQLEDVPRHIANQKGVQEVEQKLVPYLAKPRSTSTEQGFRNYFQNSTMRCISQLAIDTLPIAP
jgi:hypothetical protein